MQSEQLARVSSRIERAVLAESCTREQIARFRAKLVPNLNTGCLEWSGYRNTKGYGRFGIGLQRAGSRRSALAHRIAYELDKGPVGNRCVLHRCDNPPCCNPEHLFLGSRAENNRDMRSKGRASGGSMPGWHHPGARFGPREVEEIRRLRGAGWTLERIGSRFGACKSTVGRLIAGRTYRLELEEPGQLSLLEGVA